MSVTYSASEKKLFKYFGLSDLLETHEPFVVYRTAVDIAFRKNMTGCYVDALRRGYNAFCDTSVYRGTPEFEELLGLDLKAWKLVEKGWSEEGSYDTTIPLMSSKKSSWTIGEAIKRKHSYWENGQWKVNLVAVSNDTLRVMEEIGGKAIHKWCSDPNRTQEEVVALLKKLDI